VVRIAFLTTDHRDDHRDYARSRPGFGPAPTTLLAGFAQLAGQCELDVIACTQQPVSTPHQLAANIRYHALHVPKLGWMRTGYAGCISAVRAAVRELRPDLVHGQGTERYCALSAVFSGRPAVLTLHGNMRAVARQLGARPFSFHWLQARLESFTLPRANGVICLSDYTRRQVGPLARRTWLVPNAAETAFFDLPRRPASPPVLLCVGYICAYKNQLALAEALAPLAAKCPLRLVLVGACHEGDYSQRVRAFAAQHPWCELTGPLAGEALRARYTEATLLVHPSLEDNCPMVLLEAMAAGLPVAASTAGGIPDLVEDEKTGLLFDPDDAAQIRTKIQALLDQPAWRAALAAQALRRARERHHPAAVAATHLQIYREVLAASH
jgi:glycosyltransferase involved in cell wall biosynthesis